MGLVHTASKRMTILLSYVALSAAWIFFSDELLQLLVGDPMLLTRLQTFKGWIFVAFTAVILHVLLKRYEEQFVRSNEEVSASEERFRAAFDFAPSGVSLAAADGRFLRVNRALADLLGYAPEELLEMDYVAITHPDDVEANARLVQRALAREIDRFELEKRYIRRDGQVVWALVRVALLRDARGRPVQFVSHITDMTERRRADMEIRRLNAELERRVAERTTELRAAVGELEAFSYTVSHDLRSPLNSIDGFARLLQDEYGGLVGEEGRHYLDRLLAACGRMVQLIDDLLDLSRAGRTELEREHLDLSEMAGQVAEELRAESPERRVEFVVQPGLSAVGDRGLLRIVLENLLGNAWKFTSKRPEARIEVGATLVDGRPAFFVRDNGAGFEADQRGRLFSPFQRLHSATEFAGTGIGLATVARIIQRHGGRVWAEGEVDSGAAFYFTLP